MEITTQADDKEPRTDIVLNFPNGIPGLDELKEFRLFQDSDNATLFILQAVSEPAIELTVTTPDALNLNYELTLQDSETAVLESTENSDIMVLVTLSKMETALGGQSIHPNILGPLIINADTRKGIQKPLNNIDGNITIRAQ